MNEHGGVRNGLAVMRDDEEIHGTEAVVRTHQIEFLVHGEIAHVDYFELSESDVTADRLRVLRPIDVLSLEVRAVRVGFPGPRKGCLQALTSRCHDSPVEAGHGHLVARLGYGVL